MSKVFPVSFISDGRYWQAGEEIPDEFIRPFMLKHWKKAPPGMKVNNLRRQYNKAYPVSVEEHEMSMPAKRQAAQMQIAAEHEELDETEANTLDETTVSALAELQDKFAADVERQKLNAQIAAERHDELDNALLEEQEEKAQAGEFDEYDIPKPVKAASWPETLC